MDALTETRACLSLPDPPAEQYRSMIDTLREVVFQTDAHGCWSFLNAAWEEITGFSVEESLGRPCVSFLHPDDVAGSQEKLRSLFADQTGSCRHVVRYLTRDRGIRWLEVHARLTLSAGGNVAGVSGTLMDVTGRHAAYEELRQARQRLEFLLTSNPAVIFTAKTGSKIWDITFVSDNIHAVLGYRPEEFTRDPAFFPEITAPDHRHRLEWSFVELATQGATTFRLRTRHCDGFYRSIRGEVRLIRDAEGRAVESIGCLMDETDTREIEELLLQRSATLERTETALRRAHDDLERRVRERTAELEELNRALRQEIVERQQAESALARREVRFQALIDNTLDVIFVLDEAGLIRYVSPSLVRIFRYEPDEVAGRSAFDFVHPDDLPETLAALQQALSAPGTHQPVEVRVRHQNGNWHAVEAVCNNQLANAAVEGVIVTVRDVSGRKRLEEQFRQAQKMEAVGRLAGGVAHDFNNLLTVIRGYSELLAKKLDAASPLARHVVQIKRAADRAVALVQQLLAFSRKQVVEPKTLELSAAVVNLEPMLARLIGEDVELTITPAPTPLFIRMDPSQLEQVVINLCVNGRDAMPRGGRLALATNTHRVCDSAACRTCKIGSTQVAILTVSDTGTGITEEVRSHIFEPFFTTKEVGKGTGLGLSMVYAAVEQAGGFVCLDSTPGEGTTFRICLPVVDSPQPDAPEHANRSEPPAGSETILLVEDEELVRVMIRDSLTEAGYRVLEACQGDHAVQLLAAHQGPVHLLLTDVVMPRMGGPELAERIAAARPTTKILYISGYPRKELPPDANFLKKPFTPDELLGQVRGILD